MVKRTSVVGTRAVGPLLGLATAALCGAGCRSGELSDDAFGVMDLSPLYDGGTSTNPSAGIPQQLDPSIGYSNGDKVELYDFGVIPVLADAATGQPTGTRVQSMYFFFDKQGHPLFSRPARETRNGADHMQGGENVLNPNPYDYCLGKPPTAEDCPDVDKYNAEKAKAYPARYREPWADPNRGNTNRYQRPIIDYYPGNGVNSASPLYTGLWEIMEVTVPDNYRPDAIKSLKTLRKGITCTGQGDSQDCTKGDFKVRRTKKAINCPVLDERTNVTTGVSDRSLRHPTIELWYRRKLGFCYLANGWETLGDDTGNLYNAGEDDKRLDTFDVERIVVGEGERAATQLSVPVQIMDVPTVYVPNQMGGVAPTPIRMVKNYIVSDAKPRHTAADPFGFTPIVWLWDMEVLSDYTLGTAKSMADASAFSSAPRTTPGGSFLVKNYPMRGVVKPCSIPKDPATNRCESTHTVPDPNERSVTLVMGDKVDGSTQTWTLANGAFTTGDIHKALHVSGAKSAADNTSPKRPGWLIYDVTSATQIVAGEPGLTDETFDPATVKISVYDPAVEKLNQPLPDPACTGIDLVCNPDTCSCDAPAVGYGKVCGPGIARCRDKSQKDAFSEFGYTCFPAPVAGNKGFCYIGCDGTTANKAVNDDPDPKKHKDSRCKSLEGYFCLGFGSTPRDQRFCLKAGCDSADTDPASTQCQAFAAKLDEDSGTLAPTESNIAEGQVCQDWGLTLCAWPDGYEPK